MGADVNRGNRPLSPHLQIYRKPLNSGMSIFHRITGVAIGGAMLLVVSWFIAASSHPKAFDTVDGLLTSWIGGLILLLAMAAFWYHFFNGIRHLVWDTGSGFELGEIHKSGIYVLAATAVATVITWIVALV